MPASQQPRSPVRLSTPPSVLLALVAAAGLLAGGSALLAGTRSRRI
jgi:hypothetical protein